jgi:DNA modification methylase
MTDSLGAPTTEAVYGGGFRKAQNNYAGDTGTAARFFFQAAYNLDHADPVLYCPKASRKERDAGLEGMAVQIRDEDGRSQTQNERRGKRSAVGPDGKLRQSIGQAVKVRNIHPTVKPIALAKWLATLLLPPPEYAPRRLLIPFAGSGSEAIGAGLAGWDEMTLIEMDAETVAIARARLAHWLNEPRQLELHGA